MKARLLSRQSGARIHSVWIAALCFFASGCMPDVTVWRYTPDSYPLTSKPLTQKRLLVPPFKDSRPDSNINAGMWAFILPLGWLDYSLPESLYAKLPRGVPRERWLDPSQFKPKADFAKAAAEELHASGLFKETMSAPHRSEGDLVLYGEILSTHLYATGLSYGVSILAPVLWLIGFPLGTISNDLVIEFQLEDRVTGAVLWHKKYHDSYESTMWPYKPRREFNYDTLYKTMLRDVVKELQYHFQE